MALTVIAALLLIVSLGAVGARHYPGGSPLALGLVAATPYLLLAAPVGTLLMLLARQWFGLAAGVLVIVLGVSTQLWLYTGDDPPADAVTVHVMTSNLRLGEADAQKVVDAVRRHHVEVLMLEELTDIEQQRLQAAGLGRLLPHHASQTSTTGSMGTGLWSRYPMTDVDLADGFAFALVTAHVAVPGIAGPLQVVALHAAGPVPDSTQWVQDMHRLPGFLSALPKDDPTIIGGDFNATPDTVQFRRVLDAGFRDAADQAGAGYTLTYPSGHWYPPLIAIDHVLTRGGPVATDVRTLTIEGSDHRSLLVDIAVPRR